MDAVKRLSFEVRNSLIRLQRIAHEDFDPQDKAILDAMADRSFSDEAYERGAYEMTDEQKAMAGGLPCTLVLNKVDLITNKRKMRDL